MFCNTVSDYNLVQKCLVGQKTEDRGQKAEDRRQKAEDRRQRTEDRAQMSEFGSRTRRRPIGRDNAAAKDAEVGKASAEGREPIA
jgi:hypothetical protein